MSEYDFLTWSPLITAATWLAISGYLVVRGRYRTWTELFFLGLCVLIGAYGLGDAIFFGWTGGDPTGPASVSLAFLTFGSTCLALYGLSLHGRFRRSLLLLFIPTAAFAVSFPLTMFSSFTSLANRSPYGPPPRVAAYNEAWFVPWLLYVGALWIVGIVEVTRTYLEVRRLSPTVGRRIGGILLSLIVAIVGGFLSNGILGLAQVTQAPPLFSTFLAIPGFFIFLATTPSAARRLNDALLRRKAPTYDVKAAFLTFSDGTLIGSKIQPEEDMIDADAFSATLDVIQNFMRTSFPTLRGRSLKAIRHGEYTLIMEKGHHTYLTLILGGQDNDQLRRLVLEALEAFEEKNRAALDRWRGMAADAIGVDGLLATMLAA